VKKTDCDCKKYSPEPQLSYARNTNELEECFMQAELSLTSIVYCVIIQKNHRIKWGVIMELLDKKAVFLGDSITKGAGTSDESKTYHQLLMDMAELCEAKNYGISATRIARQKIDPLQPIREIDTQDFCVRVEELDVDADIVVVFGGTNDYGHGNAPLGTPQDRTPDTFWGACHYLMNRLIERFIGKTIVIMTPLHRSNEEVPNAQGATLAEYVEIIKSVAAWYALPVLDLYSTSGIQPAVPIIKETYCPDGLHPNDEGHVLIAERLYSFLTTL